MIMHSISPKLLLITNLAPLQLSRPSINMRLPRRRPNILNTTRRAIIKDLFNFFEGLLGGFREEEEYVDEHGDAEDAEDDVDFPSDVGECWGDEVG